MGVEAGVGVGGTGGVAVATGTAYELQALSALSPAEFLPQAQSQIEEPLGTEPRVTELLETVPLCPFQLLPAPRPEV